LNPRDQFLFDARSLCRVERIACPVEYLSETRRHARITEVHPERDVGVHHPVNRKRFYPQRRFDVSPYGSFEVISLVEQTDKRHRASASEPRGKSDGWVVVSREVVSRVVFGGSPQAVPEFAEGLPLRSEGF